MRHNLNVPEEREQMLRESLIDWIRGSDYPIIKDDAIRMVQLMGAHEFVYQLLLEYLAHHGQPFTHQLEWPNFTLQLSMSIWFSEDKASHDLYVLPSDDRFDFSAPDLATNGWLQSRGEDLASEPFHACSERQKPDQLRFVSSQSRPGTTYCFLPLLHRSADGGFGISLTDTRTGLHKALDSVVWKSRSNDITFKSVLIVPFGFELLTAQMDELVWYIWHELESAGSQEPTDSREVSRGLTIKLGFGSPQVLVSLLQVMMEESEDRHGPIVRKFDPTAHMDLGIPIAITKPWRDSYLAEYTEAAATSSRWARLKSDVPRIAEDLCTRIQDDGGLKRLTLREHLRRDIPDDRIARMLVGRRVVLRYYDLVQSRGLGYKRLIRELGFVKYDEADEAVSHPTKSNVDPDPSRSAIQNDNFKDYLSGLGLRKSYVLSPLDCEGLFEDEIQWLRRLYNPA